MYYFKRGILDLFILIQFTTLPLIILRRFHRILDRNIKPTLHLGFSALRNNIYKNFNWNYIGLIFKWQQKFGIKLLQCLQFTERFGVVTTLFGLASSGSDLWSSQSWSSWSSPQTGSLGTDSTEILFHQQVLYEEPTNK
jgi:hypothetical protein